MDDSLVQLRRYLRPTTACLPCREPQARALRALAPEVAKLPGRERSHAEILDAERHGDEES
jgi:hypothetical protein